MSTEPQIPKSDTSLVVRHGRVASVDLYEIKESELELFEKGSPADLQLNFALPLLTLSIEAIFALLLTTFPNATTKTVFIVIAIVGAMFGLYLLIAWWRGRASIRHVCKTIRLRIETSEQQLTGSKVVPPKPTVGPTPAG